MSNATRFTATCSEWQKEGFGEGYEWRQICGINGHETVIRIDGTGSITSIRQAFGGDLGTLNTEFATLNKKGKVVIRNLFKSVVHICALASSLFYASILFAQALPAGVTPQMAQQFQNMSPAQQQALAKQYGVTLPGSAPQQAAGIGIR